MAHKIWGGRFNVGPDKIMEEINASIDFDKRLAYQDIACSKAHCQMLVETGIITAADAKQILGGLDEIEKEIEAGQFTFSKTLEDIHMNIEAGLSERIGEAAGRLHIARSRNDQIATDLRLYIRASIDEMDAQLAKLQLILARQAADHAATLMPGFTHLQIAQPISYGHYLLAYVEMFARDRARFNDARKRVNESPLGAAALAGTSFPIDRQKTATTLGFERVMANSIDSVSDRDFVLESLNCAAMTAMHLSRLGEEIILFATPQFGFFKLPDNYSTGSSIMPQKRNPDAAELIRAKTGRIIASLIGLFIVMKALPLAYAKDMQEDKEGLFDAFDNLSLCLSAMAGQMAHIVPDKEKMRAAAGAQFSTATELADWLVREAGLTFREAHHITGRLVAKAESRACALHELSLADMQAENSHITESVYQFLDPAHAVASRTSFGGTAPQNVKQAAEAWLDRLQKTGTKT